MRRPKKITQRKYEAVVAHHPSCSIEQVRAALATHDAIKRILIDRLDRRAA